ncbi:MAG: proton-conducting transporter membrane subunit, partial [Candidatus Ratteibacteria bacterium]
LLLIFLFWIMIAAAARGFIGFRRTEAETTAAKLTLRVMMAGSLLMLLGFVLVYFQTGTFDLSKLSHIPGGFKLNHLTFILIALGILSAAAIFPFHAWLTKASAAPAPVNAFLNSVVPIAGLYLFIRLFYGTLMPPDNTIYLSILLLLSSLAAGFAALRENNLKRLLAYSTIGQLSLVYFALSLFTVWSGLTGIAVFILAHTLGKSGLFLTAGIVENQTNENDIRKIGGYFKSQPFLAGLFLVCAFSVIGVPPFLGFWGVDSLLEASFVTNKLLFGFLGITACGLGLVYLLRAFHSVFLGQEKILFRKEVPTLFYVSVSILAFLSLFLGLWPNLILRLF